MNTTDKTPKTNTADDHALNVGMSYQKIAEIMNITPAMVKNIEKRALKKLKIPTEKNKKFYNYLKTHLNYKETEWDTQ